MSPWNKISDGKNWPHYQGYMNVCAQCREKFAGPKRAGSCWECLPSKARGNWEYRHTGAKMEGRCNDGGDGV